MHSVSYASDCTTVPIYLSWREGRGSKAPPALNNYEDGSNWQVPGHRWLHRDRSPIFNYNHLIQSALEMLMLLLLLPYITEDCAHSLLVPSFFVSVRYTMLNVCLWTRNTHGQGQGIHLVFTHVNGKVVFVFVSILQAHITIQRQQSGEFAFISLK